MKLRLDQLLVKKKLALDIDTARTLIRAGEVFADEVCADKPGHLYPEETLLRLKEKCRYVSRGGLKLEKGLTHFQLDPSGMRCIDIGASSGGFTDCLLQHGAAKVWAVDVAYGQLDWKIRQNDKVVVLERFNARKICLDDLGGEYADLAVMDTSFISITKILPALLPLFQQDMQILSLIKPQFELPREKVAQGGVVEDPALHQETIDKIVDFAATIGLKSHGIVPSPILGPKGNKEFLIYLTG